MSLTDNIVIFFKILLCFFIITSSNSQSIENQEKFIVVIDAGHGGKDLGAIGALGTLEKNLTLRASLELAKVLKKNNKFYPILSKNVDYYLSLKGRIE